ncbi:MAG: RidA family protein, partial [Bifidobacterium mongoliense]|nr:RidA family protein [Bifidobacterium mongoliense]
GGATTTGPPRGFSRGADAVYAEVFDSGVRPARVAIGGNAIPKGALVEIDAIALA